MNSYYMSRYLTVYNIIFTNIKNIGFTTGQHVTYNIMKCLSQTADPRRSL